MFECGAWEVVNSVNSGHSHITASTNYLWTVNAANQIYRCIRPCKGKWQRISGGLMQVDASDDEVWGVNRGNQIYKRPVDGSGSWRRISGGLKHVSASGNGYVWGVSSGDRIYKCKKPCNGAWKNIGGRLKQIDGGYAYVYGVNSGGQMYTMPIDGIGNWRAIPHPGIRMKHVTASGKDDIFAVSTTNDIYRCKKPCVGEFEKMSTNYDQIAQCDATFDAVFGVSSGGSVFRHFTGK